MFTISIIYCMGMAVVVTAIQSEADYYKLMSSFSYGKDGNITYDEATHNRLKRATGPLPATIAAYPFILSVKTATTQGLGVIVNVRWALTVYPLVSAYLTTPRAVTLRSGLVTRHRVSSIITNSVAMNIPNQVSMLVLCRACPDLPNNPVNMPVTTWPNSGIIDATVLRFYNNPSALQYQTVALLNKNNKVCKDVVGFSNPLQACSENLFMTAVDYGAPILDNSTPKKLIGLAVHISGASNINIAEIYDDVGVSAHNLWITTNAV